MGCDGLRRVVWLLSRIDAPAMCISNLEEPVFAALRLDGREAPGCGA